MVEMKTNYSKERQRKYAIHKIESIRILNKLLISEPLGESANC